MGSGVYIDYRQAAEAAKRLAQELGAYVAIERRDNGFIVVAQDNSAKEIAEQASECTKASIMRFRYELSEVEWAAAEARANEIPIYDYSHREEDANIVGSLGEVIAERWFNENGVTYIDERGATTHDYKLEDGKLVDVKTKDRTVQPLPGYDCSVPLYNHEHQQPDFYFFVSLQRSRSDDSSVRSFKYAYVLGVANQGLLSKHGVVWEAGQVDPSNGTKFWTSCINVSIKNLVLPDQAVAFIAG